MTSIPPPTVTPIAAEKAALDGKGVDGHTVARRVDLGVHNIAAAHGDGARDAGEQSGMILRVNGNLGNAARFVDL